MSDASLNTGMAIDVRVGESIALHPSVETLNIVLTVEHKSGQQARLRVQSDQQLRVLRVHGGKLVAVG
jgi:hypothetical protein